MSFGVLLTTYSAQRGVRLPGTVFTFCRPGCAVVSIFTFSGGGGTLRFGTSLRFGGEEGPSVLELHFCGVEGPCALELYLFAG